MKIFVSYAHTGYGNDRSGFGSTTIDWNLPEFWGGEHIIQLTDWIQKKTSFQNVVILNVVKLPIVES